VTTESDHGKSERSQCQEHRRCSTRQKRRAPPHHNGLDELREMLFALLDHIVFCANAAMRSVIEVLM
jgi:hypothetical protein